MSLCRYLLLALLLLTLTACAVREQRPEGAWLADRQALFAEHPVWSVSGRLALSDGQRGGQLAFDWRADGDRHDIRLRTVMGGSQWRLEFEPGWASLSGTDIEGHWISSEPDGLVLDAIGWPVPVADLAWWVRGLPPPGTAVDAIRYTADGSIGQVTRPPWHLDFQRFLPEGEILLPARLQADSGFYRVRIVLRNWDLGSHSAPKSL